MSHQFLYASLMDAVRSDDLPAFRSILESKASLQNALWPMDYELLVAAMTLDRKLIVGYLLEKGCCVWKPYEHERTSPLHLAAAKPNWHDIVEKLLCLGASASARDANGDTAVHVAFRNCAPGAVLDALIESYLNETSASLADQEELGVLHIACTRPKLEFVERFFLGCQASIDSQVSLKADSSLAGYTPLHFAVACSQHDLVAYLLRRGADLYLQDRNGCTPLHLALEYCDNQMLNLICSYVSKFDNLVNSQGVSHFMAACASNKPSLVEKYLAVASHPDSLINSRVSDVIGHPFAGYTPLHFAALHARVHTARLLLYCHGEQLFSAASSRNHTAPMLAAGDTAALFLAFRAGGDAWAKEVEKIDESSFVKTTTLKVENETLTGCCERIEELDDTLSVDDDGDDDSFREIVFSGFYVNYT